MALSKILHMRLQNRTLHIMTYQVMRTSHYQQYQTNQQMKIVNFDKYHNEVNGDECDMSNADIENQMDAPTQEIVNDEYT